MKYGDFRSLGGAAWHSIHSRFGSRLGPKPDGAGDPRTTWWDPGDAAVHNFGASWYQFLFNIYWYIYIYMYIPIGSMVLVYILTYIGGILMGSMLPYIAAPWILWDMLQCTAINIMNHIHLMRKNGWKNDPNQESTVNLLVFFWHQTVRGCDVLPKSGGFWLCFWQLYSTA